MKVELVRAICGNKTSPDMGILHRFVSRKTASHAFSRVQLTGDIGATIQRIRPRLEERFVLSRHDSTYKGGRIQD